MEIAADLPEPHRQRQKKPRGHQSSRHVVAEEFRISEDVSGPCATTPVGATPTKAHAPASAGATPHAPTNHTTKTTPTPDTTPPSAAAGHLNRRRATTGCG